MKKSITVEYFQKMKKFETGIVEQDLQETIHDLHRFDVMVQGYQLLTEAETDHNRKRMAQFHKEAYKERVKEVWELIESLFALLYTRATRVVIQKEIFRIFDQQEVFTEEGYENVIDQIKTFFHQIGD